MNSKEEQTNSEVTNLEDESLTQQQKDPNYINEQIEDNKLDEESIEIKDEYKFGWSTYSEKTNVRFAKNSFPRRATKTGFCETFTKFSKICST